MPRRVDALVLLLLATATAGAGLAAEVEVRTLGTSGSASSFCGRCADGDFLVDNGRFQVVVGASHRRDESFYRFPTADALGSIVFARAHGAAVRGDIMLGTPYLRLDNTTRHVVYDEVETRQAGEGIEVTAHGRWEGTRGRAGERLRFEARYAIGAGTDRVDVSLTVTNAGETTIGDLYWSLFFDPHQVYDFAPADGGAYPDLTFRGYPRAMQLVAWVDPTRRVPTSSDNEWGWDGGMILPDPVPVSLAPGAAETRRYALVVAGDPRTTLGETWRVLGVAGAPAALEIESASREYFELVVREAATGALFYRSFLDRPAPVALVLPPGRYTAQANFFPAVARCSFEAGGKEAGCRLGEGPTGRVRVRIENPEGNRVPGKVTFRGIDDTPSPYFRPENPSYDDGYWESAKNSVYPLEGELDVELPEGRYRVSASRGPAYSIHERDVLVTGGRSQSLAFTIEQVVRRADLVSMDSHLHTLESDGAVAVEDKVRAIVAEGVDVAIATDHNYPVDYRPALERLGLADELLVASGAEVTVPERLDYNTYPMTPHAAEHNNGAVDALSTDLSALFAASRARDPNVILQVNHPRSWQFDYFNWHALDPDSAAFANDGFDLSFDVLEVVNGAIYETEDNTETRNDWFNLLRRGYFFPLVGTSDSHEIDQDEPGYSRTWIYHDAANRADLSIAALMQRVRAGRSFAGNGPLLDLVAGDGYGPGETFTAGDGKVTIAIDVTSPEWIEVERVRLYVDGMPRDLPVRLLARRPVRHLRAETSLELTRDAFLVADATGTKSLAPLVQPRTTGTVPAVVTPYALTNPVFVDVDGNGRFDPLLPRRIEIRPRPHRQEQAAED